MMLGRMPLLQKWTGNLTELLELFKASHVTSNMELQEIGSSEGECLSTNYSETLTEFLIGAESFSWLKY
jgi:hypothetical protein